MTSPRRTRVLLAVEPVVLESVLGGLLRNAAIDDVVALHDAESEISGATFDATITTVVLPASVHSDVVIVLPDADGAGEGTVRTPDGEERVTINGPKEIMDLLDRLCSGDRTERLGLDDPQD